MESQTVLMPDTKFLKQVNDKIKMNVNLCYQCRKCSAGCPMAYAMDYTPAQLIHAIRLGLKDIVLNSKTMWMCSSCYTCTTRCPQEVEIAKVMDMVKMIAVAEGIKPPVSTVNAFNKAALLNIKLLGRLYELGMIMDLKRRTFQLFKDVGLGMKMLFKGKISIFPSISPSRTISSWQIFSRVAKKEKK